MTLALTQAQGFSKIVSYPDGAEVVFNVQTDSSGYWFVGRSTDELNTSPLRRRIQFFRTDLNGILLQDTLYNYDTLSTSFGWWNASIARGIRGGYFMVGDEDNILDTLRIYSTLKKYDRNFNELYSKKFVKSRTILFASLLQIDTNRLLLYGETTDTVLQTQKQDLYLALTDTLGDIIWERTYGGTEWEYASNVTRDTDTSVIIAGTNNSFSDAPNSNGYLVRVHLESGDTIWTKDFGRSGTGDCYPVFTQYPFFFHCHLKNFSGGDSDSYVAKIKSNGAIVDKTFVSFNGRDGLLGHSVLQDSSHITLSLITKDELDQVRVSKWTNDFQEIWRRDYSIGNNDGSYLRAMTLDHEENIVMGGYVLNLDNNSQDYWIIKLDTNGCVTDSCWVNTGLLDLSPARETFGITIYPNPAVEQATIQVENTLNHVGKTLELSIIDLHGRLVHQDQVRLNGTMPQFAIKTTTWARGVYAVQAKIEGRVLGVGKLVR